MWSGESLLRMSILSSGRTQYDPCIRLKYYQSLILSRLLERKHFSLTHNVTTNFLSHFPISLAHRKPVTRHIVGFKKEESDALLKFLYDHIAYGLDFQVRVKWEPKTVVVWDNRVTAHSALLDWDDGGRRHLARITPQAERPF